MLVLFLQIAWELFDCRFHFSVFRKWHSLYNTQFFAGRNAGANSVVGWDEIVETTV